MSTGSQTKPWILSVSLLHHPHLIGAGGASCHFPWIRPIDFLYPPRTNGWLVSGIEARPKKYVSGMSQYDCLGVHMQSGQLICIKQKLHCQLQKANVQAPVWKLVCVNMRNPPRKSGRKQKWDASYLWSITLNHNCIFLSRVVNGNFKV